MERLIWSESIIEEARSARAQVALDLRRAGVAGEVLVTGPASTPGVLTKGDLDLHLRVAAGQFAGVIDRLGEIYRPTSLHAWGPTLAVFDIPATRPTGLAATPIGSEHDLRFSSAWELLRADPDLLAQYNTMKLDHFGTDSYEERKAAFFSEIAER